MLADGAHLGSLGADDDVTAVAALPHGDAALLKDSLGLHILQQCAVTLFVGLLDSSNPTELLGKILCLYFTKSRHKVRDFITYLAAGVMTAAVGTARVTFSMVVVMIAPDIGVEVQLACCQCFCCCISVAGNTTVKPDTRIAECHLRTAANTAADQGIHLQGAQNACQRTMTAAIGVHDFRRNDSSIFHIVDFKLFGVTEVLKDFSGFVSDCDSHNIISFRLFVYLMNFLLIAVPTPVSFAVSTAERKIPSLDSQRKSLNQRIRQFFTGSRINLLNCCSGNTHILSALLLRKTFTVNQANGFILIHIQDNGSPFLAARNGNKTIIIR